MKSKIIFTICSNNYWAQAMVLIKTAHQYNPGYHYVVGLIDEKVPEIDYNQGGLIETIPVSELNVDPKYNIFDKYNIVELNTAVKPTYFKFLKAKYANADLIIYIDPDIALFNNLSVIEEAAATHDIVLTPQGVTPITYLEDGLNPQETLFLNYGVYNIGFMALSFKRQDTEAYALLDWWEERTLTMGFDKVCEGMFTDQLWINLVPCYFENYVILRDVNLNMAPWNLHERVLSAKDGGYMVNDKFPLVFFHFSSYKFSKPDQISKFTCNRYTFDNSPGVKPLYEWYHDALEKEQIKTISQIKCVYSNTFKKKPRRKGKELFRWVALQSIPPFVIDTYRYIRYKSIFS